MKVWSPVRFDNKKRGFQICNHVSKDAGQLAIRAVAAGVVPTVAEIGAWRATDDAEKVSRGLPNAPSAPAGDKS